MISGKTYKFRVLPFVLSRALREFTKTLAWVVQLLRARGIRVHAYLDDGSSGQTVRNSARAQEIIHLLQSLGWMINWKKSLPKPSLILEFLSLHFNFEQALTSPPKQRLSQASCLICLRQPSCLLEKSLRSTAESRTLLLSFTMDDFSSVFSILNKIMLVTTCSTVGQSNPMEPRIYLTSPLVLEELQVLQLHTSEPKLFFFTNASLMGWGASWQELQTMGQWSWLEQLRHINWLELDAFSLSVPQDSRIVSAAGQVRNNTCTYTSSRSPQHDDGCIMMTRQPQSHGMASTTWDLKQSILCLTDSADGHVRYSREQGDSDLCFTLPRRHDRAWASILWNNLGLIYAFPPATIVPKTLERIRTSRGMTAILITLSSWHGCGRWASIH